MNFSLVQVLTISNAIISKKLFENGDFEILT